MEYPQITELLNQKKIDQTTWNKIFPIVYQQLKKIARNVKFNHKKDENLNTTVLVHEAYLKLQSNNKLNINGSKHFYILAAQVMRQVLVDFARKKLAKKRISDDMVEFKDDAFEGFISQHQSAKEIVEIDQALSKLEKYDNRQSSIVINHFYGGYSFSQIANLMDLSERTVIREWKKARAYIYAQIS